MKNFEVIQTKIFTEVFPSVESVSVVYGHCGPALAIRLIKGSRVNSFVDDLRVYGRPEFGYFMYISLDRYSHLPNGFVIKPENYKDITIKQLSHDRCITVHTVHINTKNIK